MIVLLGRKSFRLGGRTKQMHRFKKILFVCFCTMAVVFCIDLIIEMLRANQVTVIRDVPYANDGNPAHRLDLYVPLYGPILTGRPLVVWVHGGGYIEGDKKKSPAPLMNHFGFVSASINYRLSNEAKFPAQLQDCQMALAWLRKHSREYGIDPKRIGLWGHSAGGHLVSLVAAHAAGLKPGQENSVQAVCDWAGPADFLTFASQCGPDNKLKPDSPTGVIARFLGGLPKDVPDKAKAASTITWVKPGMPPFLIVHGEQDDLVPVAQAKELYEKLQQVNAPVDLDIIKDRGHDLATQEALEEVIRFFQKYLEPNFFFAPPIVVQKH
jgi:acetyl esterase/lipase